MVPGGSGPPTLPLAGVGHRGHGVRSVRSRREGGHSHRGENKDADGAGAGRGGGAMTGSAAGALQENRMTGRADCPADGSTLDTLDIQF